MKHKLIIAFIALTFHSNAQKITVKKDTIYKDAVPYAILKKKGSLVDAKTYTLQNLSGNDLVVFKESSVTEKVGENNLLVIFLESEKKITMEGATLVSTKKIADAVVSANLVTDGKITPEAERKFCLLNEIEKKPEPTTVGAQSGGMINRNRDGDIFVINEKITQSGVLIGRIKSEINYAGTNMPVSHQITLPNGTTVATGRGSGGETTGGVVEITTAKDNKTYRLAIKQALNVEEEIVEYLVEKLYL